MTPDMLNLQWNAVALYPAGYFARQIMVEPERSPARGLAVRDGAGDRCKQRRRHHVQARAASTRLWIRRCSRAAISSAWTWIPAAPRPVHLDIVADRAGTAGSEARAARSAPRPGAAGLQTLRLAPLRSLRFPARAHRPHGRHRPGASPVQRKRHGPDLLHRMGQERRHARSAAARIHALLERQVPAPGRPVDAELQRAHARQPAVGLRRPNPILGLRSGGPRGTSDQAASARRHRRHGGALRSPRRPRMARAAGHHQRPHHRHAPRRCPGEAGSAARTTTPKAS